MEERLQAEVSLLEAMYPGEIAYDEKARELKYGTNEGSFQLRLPDAYLSDELPTVLSASTKKRDVRQQLQNTIRTLTAGEEVLDSIISSFTELATNSTDDHDNDKAADDYSSRAVDGASEQRTVIVWLHYLLNTNKRKQALSPSSTRVSGVTKPGYPGVLIYSGEAAAVNEHVNELKQLNWQAFQVRLEVESEWTFSHGVGVKEVESMKEVVAEVGDQKENFLEAMRMK